FSADGTKSQSTSRGMVPRGGMRKSSPIKGLLKSLTLKFPTTFQCQSAECPIGWRTMPESTVAGAFQSEPTLGSLRPPPIWLRDDNPNTLVGADFQTASLAALTGRALTIFRAGFALNTVGSLVKGLMPFRSLVAGFLMTTNLANPGSMNTPDFFSSLWPTVTSASITPLTSFFDKPPSCCSVIFSIS